jgi:hypothetical protein
MGIKYECKLCGDTNIENFYESSSTRCKRCKIKKSGEWANNNFIRMQFLQAKHRAKRDEIVFELTLEIVERKYKEQDGKCKVSNIELELRNNLWNSLSLDRVDSKIGYTDENTVLVTKFLNNSKNIYSLAEYENILKETYLGIFGKIL